MSIAALETKLAAAQASIESGDYPQARIDATAAQAILAGIPDTEKDGMRQAFQRRGEEISALIRHINQLQNAALVASSGGLQRSNVTKARATS